MAISRWLNTVSSLVLAGFFAADGAMAQSASKIGVASAVKNRVEGSIGGGARPLAAGSAVFAREVVRTGEESTAQLLFLDETSLSIGPQSEVTLDRFVFDPNRGAGNVVLNATRGAFRFVSGSQQPSSYQVRTPVATIGVRGTIFDMYLAKNNQGQTVLVVILVEGSTTMTIGGNVYNLTKPGQALVMTEGGGIQQLNWDSTLFSVVSLVPFPLFGNHWSGDPHWTHIPNLPQDRIEQILGSGPTYQDGYGQ
jgi:ferric-dicitrate binding protein FerR (iron transport regulator)